ncbi:MAG: flagellar biosynthetic protein FliO [Fibrobacterota bacterium]|nr:flagellar biosynthetic protein FliO [Fibrobacterota bacterium]QQS03557.1 MAG: flagellar biosynthetic protein FliO [Fibrobacterota bacterium]
MIALLMAFGLCATSPQKTDSVLTDSVPRASPVLVPPSSPSDDSIARERLKVAQEAWDRGGTDRPPGNGSPISGSTLGSLFLQLFTSLALLGVIAFSGILLYRKARGKKANGSRGSLVDILETTPLSGGRQISLVRIHDRVVAVAFTASSAAAVAEFTGDSAAEIIAETGIGKNSVTEFASTLDTLMNRFRQNSNAARRQE